MKKIKYHAFCQECNELGFEVVAVWKSNRTALPMRMCEEHKHIIQEAESRDDSHMSEADHQTWGTL
jgi:hypothetical protein